MAKPPDRPIVQLPAGLTRDQLERMVARRRRLLAEERAVIRAVEAQLKALKDAEG